MRTGKQDDCLCSNKKKSKHCRKAPGVSLFNRYINQYQCSARKSGREFSLSNEQFKAIINKDCYYCNAKPRKLFNNVKKGYTGELFANGIDRKDNTKGYTTDNSLPCCSVCNKMKRDIEYDSFLKQIILIKSNLKLGEHINE